MMLRNDIPKFPIFSMPYETGHTINIKDATILDKEEHYNRRGIKEAIW